MASAAAWRSASAVAGLLAGRLGELVWEKATLMWNFKDDMDDLKETAVEVNALMHDADRHSNQDQGKTMQFLMTKFKSAAYDVDDLLDEFEAFELVKQSRSKMKLFFSSYNPLLMQLTMTHKMKKLKDELDIIKDKGYSLGLVTDYHTPSSAEGGTNQDTVAWTNEDIDIGMIGRETEKEHIMKLLLESDAEEHISVIPIVGLGGIGKTTLARAAFSDKRTKIFDLQVWVYVSEIFDVHRIGETILSNALSGVSGTNERYIPRRSAGVQSVIEQLKTVLPTKRYIIVLDDIWEEGDDNLEKLEEMLQHGGKGSKVILTTRMQRVVEKMDVCDLAKQRVVRPVRESDRINLSFLSVDDCWNVMRYRALGQHDGSGRLEEIGREIAMKCGGLPLLARSLGFLLSQNKSTEAWEDIRDRNIIIDRTEDNQAPETMKRLMLSYYYMPFKVKLCFNYCAVFPKGFSVARDHLIQQWRALGYIQSIDGHHCISYLLGMSFLRISKTSQSAPGDGKAPKEITMHDLVHDLARIIAGNELIVSDASEKGIWSGAQRRYSRHMSLINYQKQSEALKEFPSNIRSLHFTKCSGLPLQHKLFSKCKYLRVLDLSGCSMERKSAHSNISMPSSISCLMLLRYLDSSGCPIKELPKSFHKLKNMQTLILSNCALETLPDNIGSLKNLCHLDLSGNTSLNELPVSFGELSTLSFLKLSGCSKLEELPESIYKFECLRHLDMSGCNTLHKLPEKFGMLPKLLFLNLSGCSKLVKLPDNINFGSLEHLNLSDCHELQSLPVDFGNLHNLQFLKLSDCHKIQVLPESFCQLKLLKQLDLSDCHDLKELPECFGNLFQLHYLNLTSCSKLQSLPYSFRSLSKLKHLNLSWCARLEKLHSSSFRNMNLRIVDLSGCLALRHVPKKFSKMRSLNHLELTAVLGNFNVSHGNSEPYPKFYNLKETGGTIELGKLTCTQLFISHLEYLEHMENVERAKLHDRAELQMLHLHWDNRRAPTATSELPDRLVLEKLMPPRTLENLVLYGYMSIDFPNWMLDISSYLPYLNSIDVSCKACDSLPPFGKLPNLRILSMTRMPNVRKIGKEFYREEGTCRNLRMIRLHDMKNLDEWCTTRSGEEEEEFLIPNLYMLHVSRCPKLKFLPYPPKSMYWELHNNNKVLPVHGFGRLSSSIPPFHAKIESKKFSIDNWFALQHLGPTLQILILYARKSSLRTFPEVAPHFSLKFLCLGLKDLEILPEWLGQLNSLEELKIHRCHNLTSLPDSIRNLSALKKLIIQGCPKLSQRCRGEDAHKISHIPRVILDRSGIPLIEDARPLWWSFGSGSGSGSGSVSPS